jgi:hypothetical protein
VAHSTDLKDRPGDAMNLRGIRDVARSLNIRALHSIQNLWGGGCPLT